MSGRKSAQAVAAAQILYDAGLLTPRELRMIRNRIAAKLKESKRDPKR